MISDVSCYRTLHASGDGELSFALTFLRRKIERRKDSHRLAEVMDELAELALNLHWSWNHASDEIWGARQAGV